MPGTYTVRVAVSGSPALTGRVVVDADPLPNMSAADRAARQALLMRAYDWTKALGNALSGTRELTSQRDQLKNDLAGKSDSINARIARVSADLSRAFNAVTGQRAPIEGWSGLPSSDQRKSYDTAMEDARKALADFNALVGTDIPAAYRGAGKTWNVKVGAVTVPGAVAGRGQ